jgi:TPR repeat protein
MATLGQWMIGGEVAPEVPKDIPAGLDLIKKAADRYDREGMFALGKLYESGEAVPADPEKSLKLIRDAAMSGSEGARMHLGLKYANGQGVPVDTARSQYYFRLCAAHNVGLCQLWLGQSLIQSGAKKDTVTAAAWLQLAKANDVKGADPLLAEVLPALTPEETAAANKLKGQLLRR